MAKQKTSSEGWEDPKTNTSSREHEALQNRESSYYWRHEQKTTQKYRNTQVEWREENTGGWDMTRKGAQDPKTWMLWHHRALQKDDTCLSWSSEQGSSVSWKTRCKVMYEQAYVLRDHDDIVIVVTQDIQKVFYTSGTRKKRPGGRRKEASDNQYYDMSNYRPL